MWKLQVNSNAILFGGISSSGNICTVGPAPNTRYQSREISLYSCTSKEKLWSHTLHTPHSCDAWRISILPDGKQAIHSLVTYQEDWLTIKYDQFFRGRQTGIVVTEIWQSAIDSDDWKKIGAIRQLRTSSWSGVMDMLISPNGQNLCVVTTEHDPVIIPISVWDSDK